MGQKKFYKAMLVRDPSDPNTEMTALMNNNFTEAIEGYDYEQVLKTACQEYEIKRKRSKSVKQWWPLYILEVTHVPIAITDEMIKKYT